MERGFRNAPPPFIFLVTSRKRSRARVFRFDENIGSDARSVEILGE